MRREPHFEKRHFVLIAGTIKELREKLDPVAADTVATAFARELRRTNSNFDRERFLAATGEVRS